MGGGVVEGLRDEGREKVLGKIDAILKKKTGNMKARERAVKKRDENERETNARNKN